jgi:hypothetical protein
MIIKKIFSNLKFFYIFLIIFLFVVFLVSRGWVYGKDELSYGVTYSGQQAKSLGLDSQNVYLEILDDLKVKKIRLSAYWDEVEMESAKEGSPNHSRCW